MARKSYNRSVFINCPFDARYMSLFRAAVFAVLRCGFHARSALELEGSSQPRLDKILLMIEECQFGIHDLSRTGLDNGLPRFNMPFELGAFLGAKRYGRDEQDRKAYLVFEHQKHSYNQFISDLKGHDVVAHAGRPKLLIRAIRDWLATHSRARLPGGAALWTEFQAFRDYLKSRFSIVAAA